MGKKGNKRKTRWRVLPIGGDDADCLYSTNEDDGEADHAATSPTATNGPGSYARAAQPGRGKSGSKPRFSGYQPTYYRPHRSTPESRQPFVTAEKKTFNEEEYTKITTPRQDVLFKKGYLGRKKTIATDSAAAAVTGSVITATNCVELAPRLNAGDCEVLPVEQTDVMSPADEQPQYMYPNSYVDGVIYVNGGYEWYDPYGNVAVVVGPAPPFAGAGGGASVLAAVPCQPLPLQPIEWFNPAYGVPFVAPAMPQCPRERQRDRDCGRRKRCSADSQNCSPQSSESPDPPGSPQDGEGEGECEGEGEDEIEDGILASLPVMMNGTDEYAVYPHDHSVQPHPPPQPQAYMYSGAYMFGQPIYNVNGLTVQSISQLPQNTDNSGSKRRKKKRRRRRRRGGVDDGSEETSSDEKDLEEPVSLTSQESSQEMESDSKNSAGSVSCPTIVGCRELPERTPESPSSSPSLSPSLSPSPSPSNATEDKTAVPKVNYIDSNRKNRQQGKANVRSGCCTDNTQTLGSETSLQGVDESNLLLSYIPNAKNFDDIHKTKPQTQSSIQSGDSNDDSVLVIDASKINGNALNVGKAFALDNNLPETGNFSVSVCGESEVVDSAEFVKECVTKIIVKVSKQKSKGKRGLKNKQNIKLPVQNGFSELQIDDYSLKSQKPPIEMDGNECGRPVKQESPCNSNQSQVSLKHSEDSKCESEESPGSALDIDDNASKFKVGLQVPKKSETRHQHQQQQKLTLSKFVLPPQQKEEESLNLSTTSPGHMQTKGEISLLHCAAVTQPNQIINDDVIVPVVPISEMKLPEREFENIETIKTFKDSYINDSEVSLIKEQIIQISTDVCETNKNKKMVERDTATVLNQETRELSKEIMYGTPQIEPKNSSKSSNTGNLSTSGTENGIDGYDTYENNECDNQKLLSSVPVWVTSTPPVPPPRRKKWQSKSSIEHPPTPVRKLKAKKQGEIHADGTSSLSHESEVYVIDIPPSSLYDKSKDIKEFMQEIEYKKPYVNLISKTFTQFNSSSHTGAFDQGCVHEIQPSKGKEELRVQEISNECTSKPDESTKCISKKSQQILKGDQSQYKNSEFKDQSLLEEKMFHVDTHSVHEETLSNAAEIYAVDLACQILDEGLSSAAITMNKTYQTQSLSLTEAVTKWLHSQDSEEVLQVPQLQKSESDMEDTEEVSEEEIYATGPKNVYRNPLLAPSCEAENIHADAGIRVANHEENKPQNARKEMKIFEYSLTNVNLLLSENSTNELEKQCVNEFQEQSNKTVYDKMSTCQRNSTCPVMQKEKERNMKHEETELNNGRHDAQGPKSEEWDSFTSESIDYDADWEYDPEVLKHSSQIFNRQVQESKLSLESTNDKCSCTYYATPFVAKHYRLLSSAERDKSNKEIVSDLDSGREDDVEEMDALIHFRNEMEEHLGQSEERSTSNPQSLSAGGNPLSHTKNKVGEKISSFKNGDEMYDSSSNGFTCDRGIQSEESYNKDGHRVSNSSKSISEMNNILKCKSAILLSHLAEGPFPCGGICCILQ